MHYDLSHLVQEASQEVWGPIQDDEALLLYSVCRVTGARRIAEFGGQSGYSARNFLAALGAGPDGVVYTVDTAPVPIQGSPDRFIQKSAQAILAADFDPLPLDLIFFDCHDFPEQLAAFHTLARSGILTRETTLAVHDTGCHPLKYVPWALRGDEGYLHQPAERLLVCYLQDVGYECLSFHAPRPVPPLKFRHGLTLCRARHRLANWNFEPVPGPSVATTLEPGPSAS